MDLAAPAVVLPTNTGLQAIRFASLTYSATDGEDLQWRFELNRLQSNLRHYRACVLELSTEEVAVLQHAKHLLTSFDSSSLGARVHDPCQHKQAASLTLKGAEQWGETLEYSPGLRVPYEHHQLSQEVHTAAQAACKLLDKVGRKVLKLLSLSLEANQYTLHQLLDNVPHANYQSSSRLECIQSKRLLCPPNGMRYGSVPRRQEAGLLDVVAGDQPEMKVYSADGKWESIKLRHNQVVVLAGATLEYATGGQYSFSTYTMSFPSDSRPAYVPAPSVMCYRLMARPDAVLDAGAMFKVLPHKMVARLRELKTVQQVVSEFEALSSSGQAITTQPITIKLDGAEPPPPAKPAAEQQGPSAAAAEEAAAGAGPNAAAAAAAVKVEVADAGAAAARKRRKTADREIAEAGQLVVAQERRRSKASEGDKAGTGRPVRRTRRASAPAGKVRGKRGVAAGGGWDAWDGRDQDGSEGSSSEGSEEEESSGDEEKQLVLLFRDHATGEEVRVALRPWTRLSRVCLQYCRTKHVALASLKFLFKGARLDSCGALDLQSAEAMGMKDGDVVDVLAM